MKRIFDPYENCITLGKDIACQKIENPSSILQKNLTKFLTIMTFGHSDAMEFSGRQERPILKQFMIYLDISRKSVSDL